MPLYFMHYTVQFNTVNVIFIKYSNHFYSLGGRWCKKFEMTTVPPEP